MRVYFGKISAVVRSVARVQALPDPELSDWMVSVGIIVLGCTPICIDIAPVIYGKFLAITLIYAHSEHESWSECMKLLQQTWSLGRRRKSASAQSGAFVVAVALPFVAALIGNIATLSSLSTWYTSLKKPSWNPPQSVFGPVWTVLYLTMGIASWLVWRRSATASRARRAEIQRTLAVYGLHLGFNALWPVLFFGLRRLDWAFVELVALWSLVLTTLVRFYRINPVAGWLLVPYQLWTTFAALLNAVLWRLNR
jgi:translocator protein